MEGGMLKVVFLVLKICALAHFLHLQGSAGDSLSPSSSSFPVLSPDGNAKPPVSSGKIFESSAPTPASLPTGTTVEPPHGLPPLNPAPAPQNMNDHTPTSPPSTPNFSVSPPLYPNGTVPAMPPSPTKGNSGHVEYLSPQVLAPLVSPSRISPQNPSMSPAQPGTRPPKSDQHKAPGSPLLPIAPVPSAPAPWREPQYPPPTYSVTPKISPSIFPVPVASSPSKLAGSSPSVPPTLPGKPPSSSSGDTLS